MTTLFIRVRTDNKMLFFQVYTKYVISVYLHYSKEAEMQYPRLYYFI